MANNRQKAVQDKAAVSEAETTETLCVVCFKPIVYFAIGECDHLCCYECSTRIRVLCQQNDCPICRRDLAKVIFSKTLTPYQQLDVKNRSGLYDKKYRICFTDAEVQQAYFDLLDYKCPRCDHKNFPKFEMLREHVRKQHELFYCDICTEHLKVFSSERRCYNRQELALHRRKGDPDKVGHRGHPLCEYCDTRFLDKDELFRHLRKDHFFCHYCDADGRNYFYGDYVSLRDHFRTDHFLCEEGECEQEQFTSVFRTEIDLRAHRASVHGKSMNRLANKQTRTLELEFTYAPRHGSAAVGNPGASHSAASSGGGGGGGPSSSRSRVGRGGGSGGGRSGALGSSSADALQYELDNLELTGDQSARQHPKKVIDATNEQDFPTLGGSAPNPVFRPNNVTIRQRIYGAAGLARTKENFPALGSGGGETTGPTSLNEGFSSKITASSLLKPAQSAASSGTSMMIHVSNRPSGSSGSKSNGIGKKSNAADFPALPGSAGKGSFGVNKKTGGDVYADMDDRGGTATMVNLNAISAKHRALVDDYVSVSGAVSKVTTISAKDAKKPSAAPVQASVPSVKSTKAFPSLGESSTKPAVVKPVPWVTGASSSSANASATSSSTSSKKKPTPAPNLKDDTAFVNLNALTGKKSSEKTAKQKEPTVAASSADTRNNNCNNNGDFVQKGAGATKDRSKEQQQQQQKQQAKFNGQSSSEYHAAAAATHQHHSNNNNVASSTSNNAFPVLGSSNSVQFALAAGPKRTPPPGFENVHVKRVPAPPPGFGNVKLNSVARNMNNMTFTNSTGESYNILPTHSYVSPSNASKRNQVLVTHFQRALKNQDALMEFRTISQMFRDGQYEASAYYDHCKIALGDRFQEIFPELIALLPTIAKQQELYLVFCQDEKNRPKTGSAVAKGKASNSVSTKLEVCQVCKQVLVQDDLTEHYQTHYMENNFPKLGKADEGKVGASAWKK
ncbi:LOW QUALITY PROTEIN: E3 ubiquitin-protein ligase ZNF598 [Anopheles stephensi]|uniref:LOW QUALITY PROTEIN: E3 ubiquitin-protein ligase ZNF598 n=1 Tax=Anopheles stephensi TaxID=30069 RepID=UPI001658915D|nr:LOW QUALITY PROTEIN: E3 ubiquitin-protein ligase ZNF598 [Anopheles stephensi]